MTTLAAKIAQASIKVGALKPDKKNTQQNYEYISADKMLERAGDALAEAGVVVFPSVTSEEAEQVSYTDNYGKEKTRYDCLVRFAMIVSDGETQIELPWAGRGSDYAVPDKAFYKAVTSGHKYFLAKLLNVGVGNEDGEHEVAEPETAQDARRDTQSAQASNRTNGNHTASQRAPVASSEDVDSNGDVIFDRDADGAPAHQRLWGVGMSIFGPGWQNGARAWIVEKWTEKATGNKRASTGELTDDEKSLLGDYLAENAKVLQGLWAKQQQKLAA